MAVLSYALDPSAPPGREIVRAIRQQIARLSEACETQARDPGALSRAAFVHRARVRCKKIRAALLAGRGLMSEKAYRKQNKYWRDVARGLSDIRDGAAKLDALDALGPFIEPELGRAVTLRLRERLESEKTARETSAEGAAAVRAFCDAIQALDPPHTGLCEPGDAGDIADALGETYRAARRAMADAAEARTPESFHDWRKRVKAHMLVMRLARRTFPSELESQIEVARDLTDSLGGLQDIEVLSQTLDPVADARVLDVLNARRVELEAAALDAGARIYAERRKSWTARIEAAASGDTDEDAAIATWRAAREAS